MLDGIRLNPMRKSASTKKHALQRDNKYDLYMNEDIRPLSNDGSLPNLNEFTNKEGK